jgi:D-glycero-D-manno-heptose 1,7-bisphosphate phosphatase
MGNTHLSPGTRLVIFDADDTLRRTTVPGQPCPHAAGEWELMPGVREVLADIPWKVVRAGVASNQDHVGYGHLTEETARSLLLSMVTQAIGEQSASDALIAFCPHRLEEHCSCRKPSPAMLLDLMRRAGVTHDQAVFVGNSSEDEEAARRAGVQFIEAATFFSWDGTLSSNG